MTMVNNAFEITEKAGYLLGYEDNTARPGNKIIRQEAALIIARIKDLSNNATGANKFNDVNDIASWAKGGVGAVANEKYMIGYEDNTFRPLRNISREETLVTIDRVYEEAAPVETPPTTGGGDGESDNGGATTQAAILESFTIADTTTQVAITAPSTLTTSSAIFVTTSSAITVSAITVSVGADIAVTVTSPLGTITTSSAVNGVANIALNETGDYTIELLVFKTDTSYIDYIDTKYTFIVEKQQSNQH